MKLTFAFILLLATPAFAAHDPIDSLVTRISGDPLWQNGLFPKIDLPKTASCDEVIKVVFKMTSFDKGHVKKFHVVKMKQVHIPGSLPDGYTVALVKTDQGEKIVLFQYQPSLKDWWTRVYDQPKEKPQ